MFTNKDVDTRSIFVVNCIDRSRSLRVKTGELLLEDLENEKPVTLTKFPFQKLLALFVIGHVTVTTPLIEKCKHYGVTLVVMKSNLRPVFYWSSSAEANYLIRKRQYEYATSDLTVPKFLVRNKISNQLVLLQKTRKKDNFTLEAVSQCTQGLNFVDETFDYQSLMGIEGFISKAFFQAYFQGFQWTGRHPRVKCDELNVTLDIGYTVLFNFIESFIRMFGFDLYIGVYHRLWFKRKSLVCDLMEPFRCIIDHAVLLAYHRKQFSRKDFTKYKQEYHLKKEKCAEYYKVFYDALIEHKTDIFIFVQNYYRCFMGRKSVKEYLMFKYS